MKCLYPPCERDSVVRGYCRRHYQRLWRTGNPGPRDFNAEAAGRFWGMVHKTETCWFYEGNKSWNGYGVFWFDGKSIRAHRYVYELLVGPIPKGLTLDHLCRVRHCVNPDHLEPVTIAENVRRGYRLYKPKTHCKRGHIRVLVTTRSGNTQMICPECRRMAQRKRPLQQEPAGS
jgi:hypothetical protein